MRGSLVALLAAETLAGCAGRPQPAPGIRYVGSSTVANFLRDAEPVYGRVDFRIDTQGESAAGEEAILAGMVDLAGIAHPPSADTLRAGIASTLIGRDAIAVVVNARNPVAQLSLSDVKALFRGTVRNWREVGGPDLPVDCFIVRPESATHRVFRAAVLAGESYGPCREIEPDRALLDAVADRDGGVGHISFSFLGSAARVRAVSIGGEAPSVTNFDYPIARPLYLLWREGRPEIEAFVRWTRTSEGQQVVMKRFVGIRVLGTIRPGPETAATGTLVVYTKTDVVYDGGVYYYPHRPYEVLTRDGRLLRGVANHLSPNDEQPTKVELPAGTYLIRTTGAGRAGPEFFVTIRPGQTTEVEVEELVGGPGR